MIKVPTYVAKKYNQTPIYNIQYTTLNETTKLMPCLSSLVIKCIGKSVKSLTFRFTIVFSDCINTQKLLYKTTLVFYSFFFVTDQAFHAKIL